MEIIDFRVRLRTHQLLKPWNPKNPAVRFEQYIKLYKMESRCSEMPMDEFITMMNSKGVSSGVVCGGDIEDNDHLIQIKDTPEGKHFYYAAGIHPKNGILRNYQEVEKCKNAGFIGVNIGPCLVGVRADAREFYPTYAYCEANNLVAIIHGSLHYVRHHKLYLGHPKYIDEVAVDFPKLKIVISHAGNGFGNIALAVAQRHPNVYLEYSALWPKYLPDYYLQAANSFLKERCLFGTDYPLVDFDKMIEAWKDAIKEKNWELFFEKNAKRCLLEEAI